MVCQNSFVTENDINIQNLDKAIVDVYFGSKDQGQRRAGEKDGLMELGTLFVDQKWNILNCLADGDYSPLQLAEKTQTTISNISQQLKLLEAAKLVQKKKVSNRDKGKPRSVFSLSDDYGYFISVSKNFASKKLVSLTEYHKAIMKIWTISDSKLHQTLAAYYLGILPSIKEFDCVFLTQRGTDVSFNMVYNGSKDAARLASKLQDTAKNTGNCVTINNYKFDTFRPKKMVDGKSDFVILYDPGHLFGA